MCVRNRARQGIGGIGSFDLRRRQKPPHHCLDLRLVCVANANNAFLYMIGRVLRDLESRLGACKQRNGARMSQFECGRRIFRDEGLLDCDRQRSMFGNYCTKLYMQPKQAQPQLRFGVAAQDAVPDMDEPRAGDINRAPTHPGEPWIKTENTERHEVLP